ncbi:unnamed protein product [Oikopleura dioica]|uniref:Uncharacterized protein n=1 Tax=Oikopleura dioica TaxID=34765 RepID=E4YJ99_OIKDI|nr:unnamed protein product [Oikopleura dioica]
MEARIQNIEAQKSRIGSRAAPIKPFSRSQKTNQILEKSGRKQNYPIESATTKSFLDGEWERMHADTLIDFSNIRPESVFREICCPFPTTPNKKLSLDLLENPNERSSQEMSPPRDYCSFNLSDIPETP